MSSILTNTSAMVALQTLKGINANLEKTQSDISTGKAIANARDNAAVWAISKVMESDVQGFKGIADSLSLGSSTIAVARSAAEEVTSLLGEIKEKIVSSQEQNVDRTKIQKDIVALRDQISSIVGAAQFNGLNLISNREGGVAASAVAANTGGNGIKGSGTVKVLSSLDRADTGMVTASSITTTKVDLGIQVAATGSGSEITGALTGVGAIAAAATATLLVVGDSGGTGRGGNAVIAGDGYVIGGLAGFTGVVRYVARDGDTVTDIAKNLITRINYEATKSNVKIAAELDGTAGIKITNNTAASFTTTVTLSTAGHAGGGLSLLSDLDVTTDLGAVAALSVIEGLTQLAIKAASDFGTVQKRIGIQANFVNSLMGSLKVGIGALVDAPMEEASARLQALQVQQQLGIQALSIANQAPQSILSLFR